jgi:hypothetical protein
MTRASAYQEKIDFKTDTRLHWACAVPQNHIARHAECHVSTAFHIAERHGVDASYARLPLIESVDRIVWTRLKSH